MQYAHNDPAWHDVVPPLANHRRRLLEARLLATAHGNAHGTAQGTAAALSGRHSGIPRALLDDIDNGIVRDLATEFRCSALDLARTLLAWYDLPADSAPHTPPSANSVTPTSFCLQGIDAEVTLGGRLRELLQQEEAGLLRALLRRIVAESDRTRDNPRTARAAERYAIR